jgi:hypothetical protein
MPLAMTSPRPYCIDFALRAAAATGLLVIAGLASANVPPPSQPLPQRYLPVSKPAVAAPASRAAVPLHAVTAAAPGQTGYVHYFLLRLPDDSLEVQVGIELADQRIAWSFPDLGVTVSPFIEAGAMEAGGRTYEVWHLYGLRPFADDAAMTRLRRELPARVERWLKAGLPYCLDDGPRSQCISCLGFVMRALFPGRSGYPEIPASFSRARADQKYTPNDLLLYLSGMLELSDRNARMQRLQQQTLPPDLREDLEELIYGIGVGETTVATAKQKRTADSPRVNPVPRRRL